MTISRNRIYASEVTLWSDTLAKQPESSRAVLKLANALAQEGKLRESIPYYLQAVEKDPNFYEIRTNLALAYMDLGEWDNAANQFRETLKRRQDFPRVYYLLARILDYQNKHEEALENYKEVLRLQPEFFKREYDRLVQLAYDYQNAGYARKAKELFQEASILNGNLEEIRKSMDDTADY